MGATDFEPFTSIRGALQGEILPEVLPRSETSNRVSASHTLLDAGWQMEIRRPVPITIGSPFRCLLKMRWPRRYREQHRLLLRRASITPRCCGASDVSENLYSRPWPVNDCGEVDKGEEVLSELVTTGCGAAPSSLAQRLCQLWMIEYGPNRSGRSCIAQTVEQRLQ